MSRRIGQNGEVFVKQLCKKGGCTHPKGLCPKYGRYWKDVPGQHERQRLSVSFGKVLQEVKFSLRGMKLVVQIGEYLSPVCLVLFHFSG